MNKRELRKIAVLAIKEEAAHKPDEKVISGTTVMTYKELSERIDDEDKLVYRLFVQPYVKFLTESEEFRKKVMGTLGLG